MKNNWYLPGRKETPEADAVFRSMTARARRRAEALSTYGDVITDLKEEQKAMHYAALMYVKRRGFMFGMATGAVALWFLQRLCLWFMR